MRTLEALIGWLSDKGVTAGHVLVVFGVVVLVLLVAWLRYIGVGQW